MEKEKPSAKRVLKVTSAILGNLCILREYMDVMDMGELSYSQRYQVEHLKEIIPVLPPRIGLAYLPVYVEYVCRQLESIIDEESEED